MQYKMDGLLPLFPLINPEKNYINGVNYLKCDLRKEKNLEKFLKKI